MKYLPVQKSTGHRGSKKLEMFDKLNITPKLIFVLNGKDLIIHLNLMF